MSQIRQFQENASAEVAIRTLALGLGPNHVISSHSHDWPQLLYAKQGAMTVRVPDGIWLVAPQRAIWIPPKAEHTVITVGTVALRTLYLNPNEFDALSESCQVLVVTPFFRAVIEELNRIGCLYRSNLEHSNLINVLMDRLSQAPMAKLDIPLPKDERARTVAERILADPGGKLSLEELCRDCGASPRTIERLFKTEATVGVGHWRQQARLVMAMGLLAENRPVTEVAIDVGYDSTSAFIAMFKRSMGMTPSQFATQQYDA